MNIGLDITATIYHRGVSRYTSNLARALMQRKDLNLTLYGSSFRRKQQLRQIASNLVTSSKSSRHQVLIQSWSPSVLSSLWQVGLNPIKAILPDISVFHSWDWLQPPDKNLPLVSTIHDLAILKYPQTAHPKILKMHQRSWKVLREREAEIIAVSQATKKDIIQLLNIPSYKIHVIPEALPAEIKQATEDLREDSYYQLKAKLKLDQPYLLFVGTREPRKNLEKLIEAWQPLSTDYQLIIAGDKGWDDTSHKTSNQAQLRFLGRVTDKQLAVLYSEAEAFIYPSIDEGFGLPILESFYYGTPVITSNVAALIEVAGNAAQLVDPHSAADIRQGIKTILNETSQAQQKRLQRMIIRLQMFNWTKVAHDTLKVYQQAITNHQGKK